MVFVHGLVSLLTVSSVFHATGISPYSRNPKGARKRRVGLGVGSADVPSRSYQPQLQGKFMNVIETLYSIEGTSISTGIAMNEM